MRLARHFVARSEHNENLIQIGWCLALPTREKKLRRASNLIQRISEKKATEEILVASSSLPFLPQNERAFLICSVTCAIKPVFFSSISALTSGSWFSALRDGHSVSWDPPRRTARSPHYKRKSKRLTTLLDWLTRTAHKWADPFKYCVVLKSRLMQAR